MYKELTKERAEQKEIELIAKYKTNETKQKLSDKKKKKVNQYTIDGKFIKTFNSMDEASKEYDVTRQNIYANCSGKRKTACGFIWRYADEESR